MVANLAKTVQNQIYPSVVLIIMMAFIYSD